MKKLLILFSLLMISGLRASDVEDFEEDTPSYILTINQGRFTPKQSYLVPDEKVDELKNQIDKSKEADTFEILNAELILTDTNGKLYKNTRFSADRIGALTKDLTPLFDEE